MKSLSLKIIHTIHKNLLPRNSVYSAKKKKKKKNRVPTETVFAVDDAEHTLGGFDALSLFLAIANKGDNFCDFLFAFLHTKSLLKKGLL